MYKLILILLVTTYTMKSQVGIGTKSPHSSALLDLNVDNLASKKGFLGPKVALTSYTDQVTIPSPAKGLMVYNLGTAGLSIEGYLFWNGSEWHKLSSTSTIAPSISSIDCESAKLKPSTYTANTPYTGTMVLPYFDGNGSSYNVTSVLNSSGVTGLTATLQPGDLSNGYGFFVYKIVGTPNLSSPSSAIFTIPSTLNGTGCSVYVGQGSSLKIGETITKNFEWSTSANNNTLFSSTSTAIASSLPSVEGLKMDIFKNDNSYYTPRIYNASSSTQLISYQTFATVGNENKTSLNLALTAGGFTDVDNNGICYWSNSSAEVITTNIQIQIGNAAPYTYRWYEFKWWAMEIGSTKKIFMAIRRNS